MNVYEELQRTLEGLQQQRDELLLQLHLAKLEAREDWSETEARLEELQLRLNAAVREARGASDEVWSSVRQLGEDLREAYDRIRKSLVG